ILFKCIITQHFASSSCMCFPSRHIAVTSQLWSPSSPSTGQDEEERSGRIGSVTTGDKTLRRVLQTGERNRQVTILYSVPYKAPLPGGLLEEGFAGGNQVCKRGGCSEIEEGGE
ncbi:hypothetical protein KUCAC02_001148, partial [Chaenocephalus aceratus]